MSSLFIPNICVYLGREEEPAEQNHIDSYGFGNNMLPKRSPENPNTLSRAWNSRVSTQSSD